MTFKISDLSDDDIDELIDRIEYRKNRRLIEEEEASAEAYNRDYCCPGCGKYLTCRERKKICDTCGTRFQE